MKENDDFFNGHKKMFDGFYKELNDYESVFRSNDTIQLVSKSAIEYAQLGIKLIFWINAGALIALPAIIEAFNLSDRGIPFEAAAYYAGGLVSIVICIFSAYFSLTNSSLANQENRNRTYHSFLKTHWSMFYGDTTPKQTIKSFEKSIKETAGSGTKYFRYSSFFEWAAIIFALGSLFCFIMGSFSFLGYMEVKTPEQVSKVTCSGEQKVIDDENNLTLKCSKS